MLRLGDVVAGVQPEAARREPQLDPVLQHIVFSEAVIDSRLTTPEALFVALRGDRVDGHTFLAEVAARGARGALVREDQLSSLQVGRRSTIVGQPGARADDFLLIPVDEPLTALHRLAAFHRAKFHPAVIGITGSVGKTSTKEAVGAVLQRSLRTLKSPKSYNSEATLPIVALQLTADHEVAVFEMGMYGPGEIARLAAIARPDIGIVTNVGPSHLGRTGSLEVTARAKAELIQALPADGLAILNNDDDRVRAMAQLTAARVVTYGTTSDAMFWADEIVIHGLEHTTFVMHAEGGSFPVTTPLLGRHVPQLALPAAAAARALGVSWDAIIAGLADPALRVRVQTRALPGGAMLIDDSYNAAPASMLAALDLLAAQSGRRVAVLADMLELGSAEQQAHEDVGAAVVGRADILVTVGARARAIAERACAAGMDRDAVYPLDDVAAAKRLVPDLIGSGTTLLVKGSRAMELNQLVDHLYALSGL